MNLLTFLSLITDGTSVALWDDYNEQKIKDYCKRDQISISEASRYEVSFFTADEESMITIFVD